LSVTADDRELVQEVRQAITKCSLTASQNRLLTHRLTFLLAACCVCYWS